MRMFALPRVLSLALLTAWTIVLESGGEAATFFGALEP
jgi:hypothetical protein